MQNQGNGQNMKSRNQNPSAQAEPQATKLQNKKNQAQDKNRQSEQF